ncbi:hypothetical protein ACFPJ1_21120 [Kribbella qitaiheensis]|uniref:hypothetical protein n=1 Tax=Kribbella qitaiheensis TaxID=1544730 RepID=UPI00361EC165
MAGRSPAGSRPARAAAGIRAATADAATGRSRVAEAFADLLPARGAADTDSTAKRSPRKTAKKSSTSKKPRR